ncbi:reverse transcriptase [Cucumis melo var. makuwa]|uniref:Reverse transcriptase n=1 Tax=Cucumis melo var. makuwa TaxID=1194695 RepID=A0A5D3DYA8_CUCMM|nr:reverse transcriptase [Cucumis melo var. makuwa]
MVLLIDTRQVAKLNTVRVLLSTAVNKDWPLYRLDVKNAFSDGDLVEEIYMTPDLKPNLVNSSVSQRKYTLDLLTEIGTLGCPPTDTPIKFNCKLGNCDDQILVDKEQYQRLVGKLIYLSHTHPDIAFAVSVVNQLIQASYEKHMEVVNRILRYLKNKPENLPPVTVPLFGTILKFCQIFIILTDNDETGLTFVKKKLTNDFQIKDLETLKNFLGMEFARSKSGILVNQISMVSQFMHAPELVHFDAVYRILRYLKGSTIDRRSTYEYSSFVERKFCYLE